MREHVMRKEQSSSFKKSQTKSQIQDSSSNFIPVRGSHLLHGGLVKLVQIEAVDSFLGSEKQILI